MIVNIMKRLNVLILILIPILGFMVYGKMLFAGFVFDDHKTIVLNKDVYNAFNIVNIWNLNSKRFIVSLSYALDYHFFGLNPFWFHFTNIIIHLLNTYIVYFIVKNIQITLKNKKNIIITNPFLPALASVIFLIHPIQTQAVSYISQRYALLCSFFYLLTLLLFLKATVELGDKFKKAFSNVRFIVFFIISNICAIYAFFSKENSYTLPAVILATNVILCNWKSHKFFKSLVLSSTFFILAAVVFFINFAKPTGKPIDYKAVTTQVSMKQDSNIGGFKYYITQLNVIRTYFRLLFVPLNQNVDYDYPLSKSLYEPNTLASFLMIMFIFILAIYFYSKVRIVTYSIVFFFLALLIESSFIPIVDVIFEHRLYLPMFGFSLISGVLIIYLWSFIQRKKWDVLNNVLIIIVIFYLISLSFLTYKRNNVWMNELSLWSDTVKKSPGKARVHYNLAVALYESNKVDVAVSEFEKTLKLDPKDKGSNVNLGAIYEEKGDKEHALSYYIKAVENDPYSIIAHKSLGAYYAKNGANDAAIRQYKAILLIDSKNANAYDSLGVIYFSMGKFDEANANVYKALELNPNLDTAYFNLGVMLYKKEKYNESQANFEESLNINPANFMTYYYIGLIKSKKNNTLGAREYFQKTLDIKPDFKEAKDQIARLK
jgi:protein O-mannosyl-transferase